MALPTTAGNCIYYAGSSSHKRDILNGNIIHVDHHYPWSKGGSTTRSNAALVYASANLRKGATVPVPIKRVAVAA